MILTKKVDFLDALDQISPFLSLLSLQIIILFCITVEMDVVGLLRATILFTVTVYFHATSKISLAIGLHIYMYTVQSDSE